MVLPTPTKLQTVRGQDIIPFQYAEVLDITASGTEDDLVLIDLRNVKEILWHIHNKGANNLQYRLWGYGRETDNPPQFGSEWVALAPQNITVNGNESAKEDIFERYAWMLMRGRSQQGTTFDVFLRGFVD